MDAIKPNIFQEFSSLGEKDLEKTKGEIEQEALHYLTTTEGWKHVKNLIQAIVFDLDAMVMDSMAHGASFEDIGRRTAVKEVTKDVLNRILGYVDNSARAVERARDARAE